MLQHHRGIRLRRRHRLPRSILIRGARTILKTGREITGLDDFDVFVIRYFDERANGVKHFFEKSVWLFDSLFARYF
jgi:hypothetical protein